MRVGAHIILVTLSTLFAVGTPSAVNNDCTIDLVESIPENLTYAAGEPTHMKTYDAWLWLLNSTKSQLNLASFYWTMLPSDLSYVSPTSIQGHKVYLNLLKAAYNNHFTIRIVNNGINDSKNVDLQLLDQAPGAHVQWLNDERLLGQGILHSKLWLSDSLHAYTGSANMDWRSLTQVKELGVLLRKCPVLVGDMEKIFAVYWYLSQPNATIPDVWPKQLSTKYNSTHPLKMTLNGVKSQVYISSSPPEFCPTGRTEDHLAILDTISKAKKFVYISVMDYLPVVVEYDKRKYNDTYWPVIDDALRNASFNRNVEIRLLISCWHHSSWSMFKFLQSIEAINGAGKANVKVKIFKVPIFNEDQKNIPFARVNHNKYMVTDTTAYIGTSNWSGDYFLYTGGLALVITEDPTSEGTTQKSLRSQTEAIFLRDWNSRYAHSITEENLAMCKSL